MALGKRSKSVQQALFVSTDDIRALGHVFYQTLNRLLDENRFDEFAEKEVLGVLRGEQGSSRECRRACISECC